MIEKGIVKPLLPTDEKTPASLQQFADAFRQTDPTTAQALTRVQQHLDRIYKLLQSQPEATDPIVITDQNGKLIAWIGSKDKYIGAFFAQIYIGGDGPDTANLFVDNTGTLNIHNAIIVVQKDGATTTLGNYIDPNGTMGIQVKNDAAGFKTAMGDKGLFVWNDNETAILAEVANDPLGGRVTVIDPSTGKYSRMLPDRIEVYGGGGVVAVIEHGNAQFTGPGLLPSRPLKFDAGNHLKTEKINLGDDKDVAATGFSVGDIASWDGAKFVPVSISALVSALTPYFSPVGHTHTMAGLVTDSGGSPPHAHSISSFTIP